MLMINVSQIKIKPTGKKTLCLENVLILLDFIITIINVHVYLCIPYALEYIKPFIDVAD